eukprot:scaffold3965_cov414-Prasinococcus_capsulatus_cf.AAC.4
MVGGRRMRLLPPLPRLTRLPRRPIGRLPGDQAMRAAPWSPGRHGSASAQTAAESAACRRRRDGRAPAAIFTPCICSFSL